MKLLMVAAENGALPGGKVGGMGDVVRDVPRALALKGHEVSVITPGYGHFSRLPGAREIASVDTEFRGRVETVALFALTGDGPEHLHQYVLEHPLFYPEGAGRIYSDDPPERPFSSDANKFALFCAAVADTLLATALDSFDVIHLHDWHSAYLALLLRHHRRYEALCQTHLVLSIHNLAMQGVRPLENDESSLAAWFPGLHAGPESIDPRWSDCLNPLRAAINLCDKVHTVSPTYAREICDPHSAAGEGLWRDLVLAADQQRLHGILNGCEYPENAARPLPFDSFLALAEEELCRWIGSTEIVSSAHLLALRRVEQWRQSATMTPRRVLTAVGRLTEQKMGLLNHRMSDGRSALDHLLNALQEDEILLVLGSGQAAMEQLFSAAQGRNTQLLFLRGYSETLSEQFYAVGDLFLMPSLFEPCGIAQMLAMRAGQPCLAHRTGGLADTIKDDVTGFLFENAGDSAGGNVNQKSNELESLASAMLQRFDEALALLRQTGKGYFAIREAARAERFLWKDAAEAYVKLLYTP